MSAVVLEISDIGLTLSDGERVIASSPSCAVLDGDQALLGDAALSQSRLRPRWTNNRFWSELNQEPMAVRSGRFITHADLAHAHLESVWREAEHGDADVVLAIPSVWSRDAMGLLLGIASDLGIPVVALIDASVAAASSLAPDIPAMHLDLQLRRIVLTELQTGAVIARVGASAVCETGLAALREGWANIIADQFVRRTRFDPMYRARSEQQLYDRLDEWIEELESNGNATLELTSEDKTFSIELAAEQLLAASAAVYPQIVQQVRSRNTGTGIAISHRMKGFPGLADSLALVDDLDLLWLDELAPARGALAHADLARTAQGDSGINFLSSLPLSGKGAIVRSGETEKPTHLLYRARAYPLNGSPIVLGAEPASDGRAITLVGSLQGVSRNHCAVSVRDGRPVIEDRSSYGTFVNGRPVDKRVDLALGDEIRMGSPGEIAQIICLTE